MISLRKNTSLIPLLVFAGAVTMIGIAGCDSPLAPIASQSVAGPAAAAASVSHDQSYSNCADNDDRDDRDDGSCRTGQCQVYTNHANFNGTAIAAGSTIWFSAVVNVSGVQRSGDTISVSGQTIAFTANKTNYSIPVPNGTIIFSKTATQASTVFNAVSGSWITTVPTSSASGGDQDDNDDRDDNQNWSSNGNTFLTGVAFPVTVALPGGINPVTWTASFSSTSNGTSLNWQWAAAVYTNQFATSAVTPKPVDDNQLSAYKNSDNAGTPENEKKLLGRGGAMGGGGSNYTGSYSGTVSVTPCYFAVADVVVSSLTMQTGSSAPVTLTPTSPGTVLSGTPATFVATLKNNSALALPIGCSVTIDGTALPASSVTVGTSWNVSSGATTTCTFKATLTATNNQNTAHPIVVTATPPSGYIESDPAQSLTTVVTATSPLISADVIVQTSIALGSAINVTSVPVGTTGPFVVTLQNNSTVAVPIGCSVSVGGTALPASSVTVANTGPVAANGGITTCTFTTSALTAASYGVTITATLPAGYTESDPAQTYSTTITTTSQSADVIVVPATLTMQIGTGTPVAVTSSTTITTGTAATFVATLQNNSTTAMAIGCTVRIDGTAVAAASVVVANTAALPVSGTTTCTFPATLTVSGLVNVAHTIIVTAVPPSGFSENDTKQTYTAAVTATPAQGDVVVASIQRQLSSGTLISLAGTADTVSAGMLDTYVATFQNNTAAAVQVQCKVAVDAAAAVSIGSATTVPASGTATCSFTENLAATVNAAAPSPHSIVVTATPVNFVDNNSATPESLTQSVIAGADVVVSSLTQLVGSSLIALNLAANDTAKLGATDTVQALITNAGLVSTTVTCTVSTSGGGNGLLTLLGGLVSGTTTITIAPGASSPCKFTLTFPLLGPNSVTVTATPVPTAPVDPNLTNNTTSTTLSAVTNGAFTDIADASLLLGQTWSVNSAGTLVDRSQQQASLQRLTMLVTQSQAVLGTFSLNGSLVNSAGDTLSSDSSGVQTVLASSSTTSLCQSVVAGYAKNFTQVTLSICAQQTDTNPNLEAIWVEYDQAQPAGDVLNSAAQIFDVPAAVAANAANPAIQYGYDSVTFDITLHFSITGTNTKDFAHAKVIAFVTPPMAIGTDANGNTIYQSSGLQQGRSTIIITP